EAEDRLPAACPQPGQQVVEPGLHAPQRIGGWRDEEHARRIHQPTVPITLTTDSSTGGARSFRRNNMSVSISTWLPRCHARMPARWKPRALRNSKTSVKRGASLYSRSMPASTKM